MKRSLLIIVTMTMLLGIANIQASPAKVIILGVDGVSLNLFNPFMEQGVIPNLTDIAEQGGRGALSSFWPLRTMQVWTTIVTGKLPGQHGIWDHVAHSYFNPPPFRKKKHYVYTPKDRKSLALWNLLDNAGISSLTIGWPTTWPAESLKHGMIVAPKVLYGDDRRVTIKGSFWRHVHSDIQPASQSKQVKQMIMEPNQVTDKQLATMADIPPENSPLYSLPKLKEYVYALKWNIARANTVEKMTIELSQQRNPEVILSYFQCTDSLLHRFWIFQKSEDAIKERFKQYKLPVSYAKEMKQRFGKVIENCYRDVDQKIGNIVKNLKGPDTLLLLVSDHGFGDAQRPHPFKDEPYGGLHWMDGVIIANAPGITKNSIIKDAAAIDITPTVLYAMQQPIAKDMGGKVIKALFSHEQLQKQPIKYVETYESSPQTDIPYAQGWPKKPDVWPPPSKY